MEKINLSVELRHCPKVDAQVDAQEYEQYWTSDEGLTSELRFHNKLYYLVNTIIASYHHNDLNAAAKDISRLLWADDYIESEPLLSIYESGLVTVFLYIIHACANRYKFEEGYAISERSRNLLLAKRERRRELNLPFRPDSECWYRLFDAVAALKWRGSAKWRNHLYTPEELIDNYLPVEQRCLDYIEANPSHDPTRNARMRQDLGWCLLQIIRMAIRWVPDRQAELTDHFNLVHGQVLAHETGHFISHKPTDPQNPWYWEHELFKWCVLGPATPDEAFLCHQWRLDSMRATGAPEDTLINYRFRTGRELSFLLEQIKALHTGIEEERRAS